MRVIPEKLDKNFAAHSIGSAFEIAAKKNPVFRVTMLTGGDGAAADTSAQDGIAAYYIELCHYLDDGATYYKVIAQINAAFNAALSGEPLPASKQPLDWVSAPETIYKPEFLTKRDRELIGPVLGAAWGAKMAALAPGALDGVEFSFVNAENAEAVKREALDKTENKDVAFLSTNDIVMAGLSKVNSAFEMSQLVVNMRGRHPGASPNKAGNFQRPLWFPAHEGAGNPCYFRRLLSNGRHYHYGADELPEAPFRDCELTVVTNWAGLTHTIVPNGGTLLAHMPVPGAIALPLPFAVVFKADAGTVGIMHRIPFNAKLKARAAASELWRRITAE
eukprot:g5013.t1